MAPEWFLVNILFEFVAPENDIILIILSRVELLVNFPSFRVLSGGFLLRRTDALIYATVTNALSLWISDTAAA